MFFDGILFNKLNKYDCIITDCFDTLIFRDVTPNMIAVQWANLVKRKYPEIGYSVSEIEKGRNVVYSQIEEEQKSNRLFHEITYAQWMKQVYQYLSLNNYGIILEAYIKTCEEFERALEIGCTYINRRYYNCLLRLKREGKKIICLSDYYLGGNAVRSILDACGIEGEIIDDIIVSADIGLTKRHGDVYDYLKEKYHLPPKSIMIGDSKTGDYKAAQDHGIKALFLPNYVHKGINKVRRRICMDVGKLVQRKKTDRLLRCGVPYSEYAFMLYVVAKKLYEQISAEKDHNINFLSREGLILKRAFDEYQSFRADGAVQTNYFYISRRSLTAGIEPLNRAESMEKETSLGEWLDYAGIDVEEAREKLPPDTDFALRRDLKSSTEYAFLMNDPEFSQHFTDHIRENHERMSSYLSAFLNGDTFVFVDIGWRGTTQRLIEQEYGLHSKGYYVGIQEDLNPEHHISGKRWSVLFNETHPGKYDLYLNTNLSLYEQILAAPHGTVCGYRETVTGIEPICVWDPMEEGIYRQHIQRIQGEMMRALPGLIAWETDRVSMNSDIWYLCRLVMRGQLFVWGERLQIAQKLNKSFITGVPGGHKGAVKYDYEKLHIGLDCFTHPERYVKYVTKVPRVEPLFNKRIVRLTYRIVAPLFYGYTCLNQDIIDRMKQVLYYHE